MSKVSLHSFGEAAADEVRLLEHRLWHLESLHFAVGHKDCCRFAWVLHAIGLGRLGPTLGFELLGDIVVGLYSFQFSPKLENELGVVVIDLLAPVKSPLSFKPFKHNVVGVLFGYTI